MNHFAFSDSVPDKPATGLRNVRALFRRTKNMKNQLSNIVRGLFGVFAIFAAVSANAQTPLAVEDFDLAAGQLLTANGWTAHSGAGTNPLTVVSPGLTYTGYPSSGVGNAVGFTTSGEDAHKVFAVQSSGTVYAAFLVNFSAAPETLGGGYFFHLSPDPISTTFRGRVFARRDASNGVAFGLSKAATTSDTIIWTGNTYALNTTYLVVVKYTVVDGVDNDTVVMYVNPALPGGEPASPTITATDVSSDIAPGSYAIRQGSASSHPAGVFDGLRVGTTWASVTSGGGPVAPAQNVVDFNGDGKTDFAVVRNTGGGSGGQVTWFVNWNGTAAVQTAAWGISTDSFVPADYDGDNKTDIAVWRPIGTGQPSGNAFFYILQSSNNTVRIEDFGQTLDRPGVVGDYDGDGKADVAVYRPGATAGAQSTWFYRGSLNNPGGAITFVPWGVNGDFTAPGDYDGDGKNDFVVQRSAGGGQGLFWFLQSTAGIKSEIFGTPTDFIAAGDYDADGKTDLAIVRPVSGALQWWHRRSSDGAVVGTTFGVSATDFAVPGDYDGDGKTDPGVWRPSATLGATAFWYLGSTSGAATAQWGQNGDYPVANAFVF